MEVSNKTLAGLVIVAMAVSLTGTMSMLSIIPGGYSPITGMAGTTEQSGIANASLSTEVHINLTVWLVNFGTISKGQYNDTTDFSPHPFVLENNGTVAINVSIGEATVGSASGPLWMNDDTCEPCFKYNATQNGTAAGALWYASWTEFNSTNGAESPNAIGLSTNPANLVYNLTNAAANNQRDVTIHLNITPPSSELAGYKEATIYFLAAQG